MTNWQLIETAPKDGFRVLLAISYEDDAIDFTIAHYNDSNPDYPDGCWEDDYYEVVEFGTVTHWMQITPPQCN